MRLLGKRTNSLRALDPGNKIRGKHRHARGTQRSNLVICTFNLQQAAYHGVDKAQALTRIEGRMMSTASEEQEAAVNLSLWWHWNGMKTTDGRNQLLDRA